MLNLATRCAILACSSISFAALGAGDELNFVPVPAEKSGLAHVLNSDEALGKIETPYVGAAADFDRDGKLDVLWYGHTSGGAALFLGKGDGTFEFDKNAYKKWFCWHAFAPLWWNLSAERVVGVGSHNTAGMFERDASMQWKKASDFAFYQLIDADGDGRHEEVWNSPNVCVVTPKLRDWKGEIPAKISAPTAWQAEDVVKWPEAEKRNPHPLGPRFHQVYCVDLDGADKNAMILTLRGASLYSWVLERDPSSTDARGWKDSTERRGLPTGAGHYLFPEDVNVDGALDLLDLASGEWFANDGKGSFTKSAERIFDPKTRKGGAPWTADGRFELLDLTNSGRRDLMLCSFHGVEHGLFRNLGGGKFSEPPIPFPLHRVYQTFADFDGDGDLDAVISAGTKLQFLRNETTNSGLFVKLAPKAAAEQQLGCKLWIYAAGKLGDAKSLIHYRQCFMDRAGSQEFVLNGLLHVGIGAAQEADIRVRFPSGVIKEIPHAKAKSTVTIEE